MQFESLDCSSDQPSFWVLLVASSVHHVVALLQLRPDLYSDYIDALLYWRCPNSLLDMSGMVDNERYHLLQPKAY